MSKSSKRYVRCATCGKKLYNDFYFGCMTHTAQ